MHPSSPRSDLFASTGLLILRVGMGGYMLTHGWSKLQMLLAGEAAQFADPIGVGSSLSLVLAVLAEFLCALLIMVGLATRLAAVPLVATMAVAAFIVHGDDPWTMQQAAQLFRDGEAESWGSKEPALLFLISFLALIFTGPGRFAIDSVFRKRNKPIVATI